MEASGLLNNDPEKRIAGPAALSAWRWRLAPPKKNLAALFLFFSLWGWVFPAFGQEGVPVISGVAIRPIPAFLPLDYNAALCTAWLNALENAARYLPNSASKELSLLKVNQQKAKIAICALLFPVEVMTPEFSAGAEIKVFLKYPENMDKKLNAIFAQPTKIFFVMALLEEMGQLLEETRKAWPQTLEPGKGDLALLETLSARIGALWATLNDDTGQALRKAMDSYADSPSIAIFMARKQFQAGHWQDVLDLTARARENLAAQNGIFDKELLTVLNAAVLNMRGQAHFQTGQLALAEFDMAEAKKLIAGSSAVQDLNKEVLLADAALKKEKGNLREMCAALEQICSLGDCHRLLEARLRGFCKETEDVPAGSD